LSALSAIIRRGVDVEDDDDCGDDDDDGNGEDNAPYETVRLPRKLNASSWTANNNAAIRANIATKPRMVVVPVLPISQ